MSKLLLRAGLRHLKRQPAQAALAVLGIALGVAVILAIDLAVESSREALRASVAVVGGEATHRVEGGAGGVPSDLVAVLRSTSGVIASAPVVEGFGGASILPGRALRILGIDPLSEGAVRPWSGERQAGLSMVRLLSEERAVVVGSDLAHEVGLESGGSLLVRVGSGVEELHVQGVLQPAGGLARAGLRDLLVMDVSTAQKLLGRFGVVDRIDLVVGGEDPEATIARIRQLLPDGLRLDDAGAREGEMEAMIRSFDLNLTALGLLALLFGAFLIYNTMTFSVVQRRRTLGTLRAVGATRGEVLRTILTEAVLLGAVGTALGLMLGAILGRGLVRLVTRTIQDLYFVVSVEGVVLAPSALAKAAVFGIVVTLLATLPAAWEAISSPPRAALGRSFLEEKARGSAGRLARVGGLLFVAGLVVLLVPTQEVAPAFVGLFLLVLGMAAFAPSVLVLLARPITWAGRRTGGLLGAMAARGVVASLSRTGPAMASLVVAVAVTLGLAMMVSSFRGSVERWLHVTLSSDIYVSVPSTVAARPQGELPPEVVRALADAPRVTAVHLTRSVELLAPSGEVRVLAVGGSSDRSSRYDLVSGRREAADRVLAGGEGVLVSEPLAFRRDLAPGGDLVLLTPEGERAFPVVGVFRDYGSDRGVAVLPRSEYMRQWGDSAVTSMGIELEAGLGVEEGLSLLRGRLPDGAGVTLRSNLELRRATLAVFDRTFRITSVLQALVFLVAFVGVLSAMMALQLDRAREIGVLRATGLTPREVWRMVTVQTGIMGVLAGVLAVPVGVMMGLVMIYVVNRRSFGWGMEPALGGDVVASGVFLAIAGALLAGLYPSWKMSRTPPSEALRDE